MKTMKFVLTAILAILFQVTYSQTSISFTSNTYYGGGLTPQVGIINDLAPNSALLHHANSTTDFTTESSGFGYHYANFYTLAIELPAKKELFKSLNNSVWRVGVQIGTLHNFSYSIDNKKYVKGVDTIYYSSNNNQTILDSIYSNFYNVNHDNKTIGVDIAYIHSTNIEKRFSLKFGVGTALQIGVKSSTTVSLSEFAEVYTRNDYNTPYNYPNQDNGKNLTSYSQEEFKTKVGCGMQLYVPLSINFRIANKGFFKKLHCLIGVNIIAQVYNVPEVGWNTDQHTAFSSGLRFNLN